MTIYVKKQIGKHTYSFSFEGKNLHEAIMESKKLSFGDVNNCGKCGSNNLVLSAHKTSEQGFPYTKVLCRDCKAYLNFGQQRKDEDVFYLRTREDENGNKVLDWQENVSPLNSGG